MKIPADFKKHLKYSIASTLIIGALGFVAKKVFYEVK